MTAPDALKTIQYEVGAAGNGGSIGDAVGGAGGQSVVFSGTYTLSSPLTCTGGFGGYGGIGIYGSQQGAGGTQTGGTVPPSVNGNGGAAFTQTGAAGITGDNSLTAGAGGNGGDPVEGGDPGLAGTNGRVRMVFTF